MRRLLTHSLLLLTLFGGVAAADREHRNDRREDRRDRREDRRDRREDRRDRREDRRDAYRPAPVVRDHRGYRDDRYGRGPVVVRHRPDRRVVVRNRVYVNNGRYVFHNGVTRTYRRPIIRQRYYDVRFRPQLIVEQYDPVPGYLWIQGDWQWNGYEWLWVSGHFEPDTRYRVWYDDDSWE